MYIASVKKVFCLMVLLYGTQLSADDSEPTIDRIVSGSIGSVQLHGSNFGGKCAQCEVLVKYSRGFGYSVPIKHWNETKIEIELPDLNQQEMLVYMQVKRPGVKSSSKSFRVNRQYRVIKTERRSHSLDVGEKGEDKFKIKSATLACGKGSKVFDHAEIIIKKQRFSDAKIVQSPVAGCERCGPVVVRWYNEPTGFINYELRTVGRIVQGVCEKRKRRIP
ncbi:MAG: hypothetical protein P8163_09335 [Candidatus Thiodiazotropha sp.]